MVGVTLDANGASGNCDVFMRVADRRRKEFEGGNVCGDVIATIHGVLIVLFCGLIEIDDLLRVDA